MNRPKTAIRTANRPLRGARCMKTPRDNERVVDRLPLMTYGLKLSLEA